MARHVTGIEKIAARGCRGLLAFLICFLWLNWFAIGCSSRFEPAAGDSQANADNDASWIARMDYYHDGQLHRTYTGPFVRCTRHSDYLVVSFNPRRSNDNYLIGVRTLPQDDEKTIVTETLFSATVDKAVLPVQFRRLSAEEGGGYGFHWLVTPAISQIRIDQSADVRFEMDIRKAGPKGTFVWAHAAEPWREGETPRPVTEEPCFP